MAFLIFIVVVAVIAAFSVSIIKAVLFSVALLLSIVIVPFILMIIIGFLISPYTVTKRKRAEKKEGYNNAEGMLKDMKNGEIFGQVTQVLTYVLILVVSYRLGKGYFWAAVAGITIKSFFDFLWGDLPFQKQKFARDEFGNEVNLRSLRK